MKWIRRYELFLESSKYSNKNIISEICIAMTLINNEFLDSILDRGLKARYSENSSVFLTDLKNLLLSKNRLTLGAFDGEKFVKDDEISKINGYFDNVEFNIERDWNTLINSRNSARSIIDKLLPDEKLTTERISNIFWIGPNKSSEIKEDIVIELKDGKQYSIFLNKNLESSKTSSFSAFAEYLIGDDVDLLFSEAYIKRWDKLTSEWIKLIYENCNKNIQRHIEKFIDPSRIDTIGYFEYFNIKHGDPSFKNLGEMIKELDKNILKFGDLMTEIWKGGDRFFMDFTRVKQNWNEIKIVILNSKILENLLTTSIKNNYADFIEKLDDGIKLSSGSIKMKLFKIIVDKMGCLERDAFYVSKNGDNFQLLPSREFFREFYDDIDIKFDYHVKFKVDEAEDDNNDFKFDISMDLDDNRLIDFNTNVKFSGGEMSGKLTAKHKFNIATNFNYLVGKKRNPEG
jgi:hypothetical protein